MTPFVLLMNQQFGQSSGGAALLSFTWCHLGWLEGWGLQSSEGSFTCLLVDAGKTQTIGGWHWVPWAFFSMWSFRVLGLLTCRMRTYWVHVPVKREAGRSCIALFDLVPEVTQCTRHKMHYRCFIDGRGESLRLAHPCSRGGELASTFLNFFSFSVFHFKC